jgi:hypothetical protein
VEWLASFGAPFLGKVCAPELRPLEIPRGIFQTSTQLVSGDKMLVQGVMKRIGHKFLSASSDKGGVYIDLKYTSHVPDIGQKVWMIVRVKGGYTSHPLKCVKILHQP